MYWCHCCSSAFQLATSQVGLHCNLCRSDLVEEIGSEDDPRLFRPMRPVISNAIIVTLDLGNFPFASLFSPLLRQSTPATPEQVQRLQTVNWPETQGHDCAICQSEFQQGEEGKRLECQHVYHKSCLDRWLMVNAVCPVCRRRM